MEFYNRMKQKLAEELDGDPPEIPEGNDSDDVESLKAEIAELKHHINSNYTVYVRRLEKRKSKIKELEDYLRGVLQDKEDLAMKAQQADSYRLQLTDCREQLEQIEGFQNQELGKVKHMLLSAEAALELEKQKRLVQTNVIEESAQTVEQQKNDLLPGDSESAYGQKIIELRFLLLQESSQHQTRIKCLEAEVSTLKENIVVLKTERDIAKASLLEAEIASHETDQSRSEQIEALKMEVAKFQTGRETLEVTLSVRDNEIKSKKEECRKEKENYEEAIKTIESKSLRITALEAEIANLKGTLSERLMQMRDCQKDNDRLSINAEALQQTIDEREATNDDLESSRQTISFNCEALERQNQQLQSTISGLHQLAETRGERIAALQKANENLSQEIKQCQDDCKVAMDVKQSALEQKVSLEREIPSLIESSERVRNLDIQVANLAEELSDKRQAIRLLQIRSNEMKKMLQKELKTNSNEQEQASGPPSPTVQLSSFTREKYSPSPLSQTNDDSDSGATLSDVNVKYLRHVIFKFMTSPDYEAKQMTKAVATLLQFSLEEERLLHEHLDCKMSWFGARPKISQ